MADWGFLKQIGWGRNPDKLSVAESVAKHAHEFELKTITDEDGDFKTASPPHTQGQTSPLQRLRSEFGRKPSAKVTSTVVFDASDGGYDSDSSVSTRDFSPPSSPTASTTSLHANGYSSAGSRPGSRQSQIASSKSGLTFLDRVAKNGIHAAIRQEVAAIQRDKIDAFSQKVAEQGIDAAIRSAERDITDQNRTGRTQRINPIAVATRFHQNTAKEGSLNAAKSAFEQIQDHHHLGTTKGCMDTNQIAANFKRNGSGFQAAEITLAQIEASQHHIQVNELSSTTREAKDTRAERGREGRPSLEDLYDVRVTGLGR
ncbi:MAG: hypothetical protein EOR16_31940 [Mesorhizobium sp.]|uniref:hypothetical protein n=1 Tax=Mesorhizobium sp. TaxID=1871066 RepID=UPI000FE655F5|nr:hypothetical protein [Mesorhizobium sp.]RWI49120.1 MAG: hypothetical protein EOR16_31940 [Mesorhizobium sp.]